MNNILIIEGPTATGKTKLALELAKKYNGELVSADSRQIYKGMDIGTGKDVIGKKQLEEPQKEIFIKDKVFSLKPYDIDGIYLWMYDIVFPDEEFSVSHYAQLANVVIEDILKRNKLPIVVGGTGLYIQSLLTDIETIDIPPNQELRQILEQLSVEELQEKLKKESAEEFEMMNNSDSHNPRRLIRKIEILTADVYKKNKRPLNHRSALVRHNNILQIGLALSRMSQLQKIKSRVHERVAQGILEEVQTLLFQGYSWELPSMRTFGYKEWQAYMTNPSEETKQKSIEEWIKNEEHYAKKQMTWFQKQENIDWYDIESKDYPDNLKTNIDLWYTAT